MLQCLYVNLLFVVCYLPAGDVIMLAESVQCSEDLGRSKSSLPTPVFYASGNRLFKCRTIYDVTQSNNSVVCCSAEQFSSVEHHDAGASDTVLVSDRICPYCNQLVAGSVSQAEYEQHIQSHLDSDADDDVI